MNKISCDICIDLIPLVSDHVASKDSQKAVAKHIKECASCRKLLGVEVVEEPKMNDRRVILKIKKQLYFVGIIIIVLGAVLGVALTSGMGMFYNILIMPTIGAIGYFAFTKKAYYVPLILFVFIYIWLLITYIAEGVFSYTPLTEALMMPANWAFIYGGLCSIGIIIGFLLKIAFGKEEKR